MKIIEVDEDLYQYIAGNTHAIGESASDILRRLLNLPQSPVKAVQRDVSAEQVISTIPPQSSQETSEITNRMESDADRSENQTATDTETKITEVDNTNNEQAEPRVTPRKASDETLQSVVGRLTDVLGSNEFKAETKGVMRFLMLLTALYRSNPEGFAQATDHVAGRTRVYFARDEATLLASGPQCKPKQIPHSPFWVVTNNNSQRKLIMIQGIMEYMQLPESIFEQVEESFTA